MAVKIRLARRGRRKQPYYHIIVADARSPRDGKFIERIGSYNPMSKPATIELDRDKAFEWLQKGAQPTDTARSILRFKGVLYRTHLQRGVTKGAMTQEEADALYNEYVTTKEAKVAERFLKSKEERLAFHKKVSGTPSKVYVEETAAEEALNEFQEPAASDEGSTEAVVETPETSGEAPASEATPVVEDAVPEPAAPEAEPAAPVADETTEAPMVVAAEAEDKAETKAEAETVEAPATEVKDESPATNSESTTQEEE